MKASEVVREALSAIESEDFIRVDQLFSDKLKVQGIGPVALGKKEYLGVHRALSSGLPDFKFNHEIVKEDGARVSLKVALTGTHTREMKAPIPGLANIPATGKAVKMPEERIKITVEKDKIVGIELEPAPGGGLPGLLGQIGVVIPR